MVIPLRVQCSKDFVCNRRQHSSRSRRASLSLGIRFEAGNVIVLRGESPQSSSGRASSSAHSLSWKRGESGSQVQLQTTNAFRQQHGCKWNPQSLKVIATACKVCVSHILALRGVSRSTGDETRQPADFNRVAAPLSLSSTVYWRTAHGVRSARVLSAVAISCGCSSDRGRPDEPFW